jgi:hypothetical protein
LGYEKNGEDRYLDGETGIFHSVSQLLDSVVSIEERTKDRLEKEQPLLKQIRQLEIEFKEQKDIKAECDEIAEKNARKSMWWFAIGNIVLLILWTGLIFAFGWETMEQWTYLAGALALVFHSIMFALTGKRFNSEESKKRRLEKERTKEYGLKGFNLDHYTRLETQLELARRNKDQLLEDK